MNSIRLLATSLMLLLGSLCTIAAPIAPERLPQMLGCRACHRLAGSGGQLGPDLNEIGRRLSPDALRNILISGREENHTSHMPRYDYLSEQELQQLLDILQQQ